MPRVSLPAVLLVASASCALIAPGPASPSQPQAAAQPAAPPSFPIVKQAIDEADALAGKDPAAAEQKYLRARAALLKLWGEQRGGDMPNNRLMRAFGHVDEESEGTEADELMWRTFLGRSRALEALGRTEELLGELPDRPLDHTTCWGDLASACSMYISHLRQTFPDTIVIDKEAVTNKPTGKIFPILSWRLDNDVDSMDTTKAMLELPALQKKLAKINGWVLIEMPASSAVVGAKGHVTLKLIGHDLGIRTGENCKKYLKRQLSDDGHIQVEERCDNVQHETVRTNELVVNARASGDLPPAKWGDHYILAVPANKLAGGGHSFRWPDGVILRVDGKHGYRYWFGANLDWSLPHEDGPAHVTRR